MTKLEKAFLGLALTSVLYLSSPGGSEMSVFQWVQYFIGCVAIFAFVIVSEKE